MEFCHIVTPNDGSVASFRGLVSCWQGDVGLGQHLIASHLLEGLSPWARRQLALRRRAAYQIENRPMYAIPENTPRITRATVAKSSANSTPLSLAPELFWVVATHDGAGMMPRLGHRVGHSVFTGQRQRLYGVGD